MRTTLPLLTLITGGALLVSAPVFAQPAESEQGSEQVLVTKFYEAFKKSEFRDAVTAFDMLKESYPVVLTNKQLLYMKAVAHYNLKDYDPATASLETLLELQEDHVDALFLFAKIRAQEGKSAQDIERAKDLLLQSARAGQFVIRDISSADGQKIFKSLLKDPGFILRVMNASNEFQVSATGLRNPFKSPLKLVDGDQPVAVEETAIEGRGTPELERRIESLFREIEQLAQERNVEELIGKFTELRQIMNEFGSDGSEVVKKKMEKWNQRLAQFGEVQLSIQLQIYINEGNQHLRAMAEHIRRDEYEQALERFELIKELKDQMYAEEREVFHRNAEALFLRGKALADRAERLKQISEFVLDVTGIVVAPPGGDEKDSAIINDRIYHEGDTIIDEETDEEIEGLRVVEIIRSTVRFRYEDTEFVRELRTP